MSLSNEYNSIVNWFKHNFKRWFFIVMGILVMLFSAVVGIYVGVWLCFIGGIMDIVNGFNHNPMEAFTIAIGVAKFFFSGVAGWLSFLVGVAIGRGLIEVA